MPRAQVHKLISRSANSIFALLCVLALANIAHTELTRIPVHRNPGYVVDGAKAMVSLMHKYGITPTMEGPYHRDSENNLLKRQAGGSSGPIPVENQGSDLAYIAPVTVGTPGQTLQVIYDSGSSDFWLWSTGLPRQVQDAGLARGVQIYNASMSSTYHNITDAKWRITYGDGSYASGRAGTDNLQMGNIVVEDQVVELAYTVSPGLVRDATIHGLLGLGFGSINTVTPITVKTPLENMIAQKNIPVDQSLFTAYLGSIKDVHDPDQGKSFFTFGAIDWSVVQASGQSLQYVPVIKSRGFWEFKTPTFSANGATVSTGDNTAIVDTGTTLMLVEDWVANEIYKGIPGAVYHPDSTGWLFPDNLTPDQLPLVTFQVGSSQVVIEKESLAYAPANRYPGYVYGGIQSRGSLPFDIWGGTFLKCVYAVFDAGNLQFGWVQRGDPTPNNIGFPPAAS